MQPVRLSFEARGTHSTQRTVDRLYVDRTFGGQDWFGLRQQAIKVGIYTGARPTRHRLL